MQKKGYRKSVWCADTTSLPVMSGSLKKRAKTGSWQKRFFCTNNAYLNYYNSSKMEVVKASLDLRKLADHPHLVDRFGEFELNIAGNEKKGPVPYRLKADNVTTAKAWVEALTERRNYYLQEHNENHESDLDQEKEVPADPQQLDGTVATINDGITEAEPVNSSPTKRDTNNAKETSKRIKELKKEGMLQKRSPSRFKAWQDRYFKLDNGSLMYYKSKKADKGDFLGEIVVDDSCTIAHEGRIIRIETRFRVYELQSSSVEEARQWATALESLRKTMQMLESQMVQEANREEKRKLEQLKKEHHQARQPPEWILKMEKSNDAVKAEMLQCKLDELFEQCDGDLITAINAATTLIEEVEDMARECMPSPEYASRGERLTESGREPKPEVFKFCLRFYHMRFVQEISLFVLDEGFKYSSSQDLLRLMDLIVAYSEKMEEILTNGDAQELREQISTISILTDNVQHMTELYIDRLQRTLGTWIDNIVASNLTDDIELRVSFRSDGKVETPAPIDIFNMINETMMMATSSGVEALQAAALSTCLVATADYLNHIVSDAVAMRDGGATEAGRVGSPRRRSVSETKKRNSNAGLPEEAVAGDAGSHNQSSGKALDLRLVCALVNDCWAMSEQIDKLYEKYGTHAEEYGIDVEAVHEHYNDAAMAFMGMLADMVMGDLAELESTLFTRKHIQEDLVAIQDQERGDQVPVTVIARVSATIEDYMVDFKTLLDTAYFVRAAKLCIGHFISEYCSRLLRGVNASGMTRVLASVTKASAVRNLSPNEMQVIEFDRRTLLKCLESTAAAEVDLKRLYRNEFLVLDDIFDLLTVTPDFFPASVHKLCSREPPFVWRFMWHVAQSCLQLRTDLEPKQLVDIESACKLVVRKSHQSMTGLAGSAASTTPPDSWSGATLDVHPYAAVWFSLRDNYGAVLDKGWHAILGVDRPTPGPRDRSSPRGRSIVEVLTRNRMGSSPSAQAGDEYLANIASRAHARSVLAMDNPQGKPRKSVLNAPTDLSDKASRERRDERRNRVSTATREELERQVDVELHGYLDKRSPQGIWQRRWFILRKLFDPGTSTWRQVLAWHKDHTSPPKSHLFVDDIVSVTVSPSLGVVLKPDGLTYTLKRSAPVMRKKKGVTTADHEFKIVCRFRVYTLRARSVHDVLTWVNGLKRVCMQNTPKPGNSLPLPAPPETVPRRHMSLQERRMTRDMARTETEKRLQKMSTAKLRGVCAANGLDATSCATKSDLVKLISHGPSGCPENDELDDIPDDGTRSVQDQHRIAQGVWMEERKRMLMMRSAAQLRKSCETSGVDISDCDLDTDRDEVVERILATERVKGLTTHTSADSAKTDVTVDTLKEEPLSEQEVRRDDHAMEDLNSKQTQGRATGTPRSSVESKAESVGNPLGKQDASIREKEARSRVDSMEEEIRGNIRQLIARGHQFVEENMSFEAMALFDKAVREAQAVKSQLLEAHALAGLGTAYLETVERKSAAPMMFEMAAGLYQQLGEKSDHQTAVIDAANAFVNNGFPDQAIQVLERGGGAGVPIFATKLAEIKARKYLPVPPSKPAHMSANASKLSDTANQISTTWKKAMRIVSAATDKN